MKMTTPSEKNIEDFISSILANKEPDFFRTEMSIEEEEDLIESFRMNLLELSAEEMVELAKKINDITYDKVADHPEAGLLVLYLLDLVLKDRFTKKFLEKHKSFEPENPKEKIEYSKEEEEELANLILALKPNIPESNYFKIDSLVEFITGKHKHLMKEVWKKHK
jgi:hypothetical protein